MSWGSHAAAAELASAANEKIGDLRAFYGTSPKHRVDGGDEVSRGTRGGVQWFTNLLEDEEDEAAFLFGIEGSVSNADDESYTISTLAATAYFGVGWKIQDHKNIHLEVTPFIGVGRSDIEREANSASDTRRYMEGGIRAAAFYTFGVGVQLGLDLRYLYGRSDVNLGTGEDIKFFQAGPFAAVVVGYRF